MAREREQREEREERRGLAQQRHLGYFGTKHLLQYPGYAQCDSRKPGLAPCKPLTSRSSAPALLGRCSYWARRYAPACELTRVSPRRARLLAMSAAAAKTSEGSSLALGFCVRCCPLLTSRWFCMRQPN